MGRAVDQFMPHQMPTRIGVELNCSRPPLNAEGERWGVLSPLHLRLQNTAGHDFHSDEGSTTCGENSGNDEPDSPQQNKTRPGERPVRRVSKPEIPPSVTTLAVRNIPQRFRQEHLLALWVPDGSYNFLYAPFNEYLGKSLGQAFINFASNAHAKAFSEKWNGAFLRG